MSKRKKIFITSIIIVITAAVVMFGFKAWKKDSQKITFITAKVTRGQIINTVTATGTIQAIKTVAVGTQVSGVISKIYADYNSHVTKGQLLAELDKRPLMLNLENSQASFENAKAEMTYQTSNYNRIKTLFEKKLVAQSDYDLALYNFSKTQANFKSASIEYNKATINLNYATIYSPIDGVVLERAVDEGQTVAASFSTPTLFSIANDLTQMQVEVSIDEADIGQIKQQQKVSFTVDAFPDLKFSGEVTQIRLNPVTKSNVVTYTVIVKAPNPDYKLMPGMTASITIIVEESSESLTIPRKVLRFSPDNSSLSVYINSLDEKDKNNMQTKINSFVKAIDKSHARVWVKQGNIIRPVLIEIGIEDDSKVNVLSGLKEGEDIVVSMNSNAESNSTSESNVSSPFMPKGPGKKIEIKLMSKKIIVVKELRKDYHVGEVTVHALRNINLDIEQGEFVAIMGSSGSGKSTMLNIIGCLDNPSSGEYLLDDISISVLTKKERAILRNLKLGFVFQAYNLLPRTTALENVELPLFYNPAYKAKERKEIAIKALESVGLADRMYHMPNQLSGGQQQRVAIARSLVNNPLVILADEATGNLDTRTSYEIMALFQELNNNGKTIVFVTHEPEIARCTSRQVIFRDGHIIREQKVNDRLNAKDMLRNLPVNTDYD